MKVFLVFLAVLTIVLCLQVAIDKRPATYIVVLDAASTILEGENPYAAQSGLDYFKYSPLAGLLMTPFLAMPRGLGTFLFVLLQCIAFYWGFVRFSRVAGYELTRSLPLLLVAFASVALDLATTIQTGQVNAGILALMMLGAAQFAEKKFVLSGLVLSLASNLKLFPLFFGVCLLTSFRARFWLSFLGGLVLWLALPGVFLGFDRNLELHQSWVTLMTWDQDRELPMLDVGDFLERHFGVDEGVRNLWALIVGAGVGIAALCLFRRKEQFFLDRFLLPLNGLYVLLFSYLSESATSVLATPGIFLIGAAAATRSREGEGSRTLWLAWIAALALVPFFYTDAALLGLRSWARGFHLKTLGYLFVFCANVALFLVSYWGGGRRRATSSAG